MNLIKKIIASILVLSIPFSIAACSADTSWAYKVDGTNVQAGVYILYLMDAKKQVESQNTDTSKDEWAQTIQGVNALTWANNYAADNCRKMVAIERDFKARKLTFTTDEQSSIDTQVNNAETSNAQDYTNSGISLESLTRYYTCNAMEYKLFTTIYGPGGQKAVSDAALQAEFLSKYVRIKHILIPTVDVNNNNAPLTAAQVAAAKVTADADFIKAKATTTDAQFMALVQADNKDPGMNADPSSVQAGQPNSAQGYIITKANSGMVAEYAAAAATLKVGQVVEINSAQYGYFIMKGYDLMENNGQYFTQEKSAVLQEMKSAEFSKTYDDLGTALKSKTVTNSATIALFKVQNLQDITASSAAS